MAAKPLTEEGIALTEKKMDMSLDDIIKMFKTNTNKGRKPRVSNRSQKFSNIASQDKNAKVRWFMDSRSSLRQGALAQRRTNFQGDQFPLATEAARKAAVAPIRNRAFNRKRVVNVNKPRVAQTLIRRKAANGGGSNVKQHQQQVKPAPKQPAAPAASEASAEAEASNIRFTLCKHEGAEDDEINVSAK